MFCHHFLSLFVARQKEKENPDISNYLGSHGSNVPLELTGYAPLHPTKNSRKEREKHANKMPKRQGYAPNPLYPHV